MLKNIVQKYHFGCTLQEPNAYLMSCGTLMRWYSLTDASIFQNVKMIGSEFSWLLQNEAIFTVPTFQNVNMLGSELSWFLQNEAIFTVLTFQNLKMVGSELSWLLQNEAIFTVSTFQNVKMLGFEFTVKRTNFKSLAFTLSKILQ